MHGHGRAAHHARRVLWRGRRTWLTSSIPQLPGVAEDGGFQLPTAGKLNVVASADLVRFFQLPAYFPYADVGAGPVSALLLPPQGRVACGFDHPLVFPLTGRPAPWSFVDAGGEQAGGLEFLPSAGNYLRSRPGQRRLRPFVRCEPQRYQRHRHQRHTDKPVSHFDASLSTAPADVPPHGAPSADSAVRAAAQLGRTVATIQRMLFSCQLTNKASSRAGGRPALRWSAP